MSIHSQDECLAAVAATLGESIVVVAGGCPPAGAAAERPDLER